MSTRMRILFLSQWFPVPADNGSKLRIFNLLRGLSEFHEIDLISFRDQGNPGASTTGLEEYCSSLEVVGDKPFQTKSRKALFGFFSTTPRSLVDMFSPEMADAIRCGISRRRPDLVIASQIKMASYRDYFAEVPAIFEEVEIGSIHREGGRAESFEKRLRSRLTRSKHRRYLGKLLRQFQAATVASVVERELLCREVQRKLPVLEVIPNCVDMDQYLYVDGEPEPNTIIFTGSFSYEPNYQAMIWFIENVMPSILRRVPDAHLRITGDPAGRQIPDNPNVEHLGFVGDIRPYIASSSVSVVPIWQGGGTRLKILEAMALQTPIVSTSKGAEGLDVEDGKHLLLADTADSFAKAVIRVLEDSVLGKELAGNASSLIQERYTWPVAVSRLLSLIDQITQSSLN